MSSTKHEKSFVDFDKPYEQNLIGLRGIIGFGIGLLLLIVVTFGLMWAFEKLLEDDARATKSSTNPMAMSDKERLPPEPRLQGAPGFGVDGPNGRANFELGAPQAEYLELKKQWDDLRKNGRKDPNTGAITALSIEDAMTRFLAEPVKAKTGPEAEKTAKQARTYITDASAGRLSAATRR
ncbi:MAG: hypothetical protein ACT4O9_04475 [Blastocatellia bacterium]